MAVLVSRNEQIMSKLLIEQLIRKYTSELNVRGHHCVTDR